MKCQSDISIKISKRGYVIPHERTDAGPMQNVHIHHRKEYVNCQLSTSAGLRKAKLDNATRDRKNRKLHQEEPNRSLMGRNLID